VSNDTVNEHVYIVNKRMSISEKTGDLNSRPKQERSEIMKYTLPRHRRKNNRRKVNTCVSTCCASLKALVVDGGDAARSLLSAESGGADRQHVRVRRPAGALPRSLHRPDVVPPRTRQPLSTQTGHLHHRRRRRKGPLSSNK